MGVDALYGRRGKRVFDVIVSGCAGAVAVPLFAIAAVSIRLDSRGPVFFMQTRVGQGGREFELLKFRTMTDVARVADREILAGDAEVTRVGAALRRLKVDELPQLWNVLRGDMSLVGPRPCLPEQLESFNDDGNARLQVRPGLTGLAQVNGNVYLSWPDRWKWDRRYVENLSPRLDLEILARTFMVLTKGEKRMVAKP